MFKLIRTLIFYTAAVVSAITSLSPEERKFVGQRSLALPDEIRTMYEECDEKLKNLVSCVGAGNPANADVHQCIVRYDCNHLVHYQPNDTSQKLSVRIASTIDSKTKDKYFFALGFANDAFMDNALVVACIKYGQKIGIHVSHNTNNRRNIRVPSAQSVVHSSPTIMKILGKYLFCEYHIDYAVTIRGLQFALDTSMYHVIFSRGKPKTAMDLGYHTAPGSFLDRKLINLKEKSVRDITTEKKDHVKTYNIHVVGVVAAYTFFIPISVMTARFYRESCNHWKICQRRPWFTIHLFGNITAILCIWGSQLLEIAAVRPGNIQTHRAQVHYYVGMVAIYLTTITGIFGIGLVSVMDSTQVVVRQIVGLLHWFLGTSSYMMGLASIMLSPYTMPYYLQFCSPSELLIIIWIFIHGIFYSFLTFAMYERDRIDVLVYNAITEKLTQIQEARLRAKTHLLRKSFAASHLPAEDADNNLAATTEHFEKASRIMGRVNYNQIIGSKYREHQVSVSGRKHSAGGGFFQAAGNKGQQMHKIGPLDNIFQRRASRRLSAIENTPHAHTMHTNPVKSSKQSYSSDQKNSLPDFKMVSFRGSDGSADGDDMDGMDDNVNNAYFIPEEEFDEQVAITLMENLEDPMTGHLKKPIRTFIQYPLKPTERENPDTFKIMVTLLIFGFLCFVNMCLLIYFFNTDIRNRGCQHGPENKFTFIKQFLQLWSVN